MQLRHRGLLTQEAWQRRLDLAVRGLVECAQEYRALSMRQAPESLPATLPVQMGRPMLAALLEALESIGEGMNNVAVTARGYRLREATAADMERAREHLRAAADIIARAHQHTTPRGSENG